MTRIYQKGIASMLIVASLALSACGDTTAVIKDKPLQDGDHGQVDLASASDMQTYASMIRTQVRTPAGVQDSTRLETGRSTQGQMAVGITSGMGAAAIGAAGGIIAAGKKKHGGNISIGVQGGSASAGANSASDANAGVNASGMPLYNGCDANCE